MAPASRQLVVWLWIEISLTGGSGWGNVENTCGYRAHISEELGERSGYARMFKEGLGKKAEP